MYKIIIPPMLDVKVTLYDGTTLELHCDGEYCHEAELYDSCEVEHLYIRPYLEDDWIEIPKGAKNGFVQEVSKGEGKVKNTHFKFNELRSMVYPEREAAVMKGSEDVTHNTEEISKQSEAKFSDLANTVDEPENLGKDFLKAQLSTKNQMKIRNILAILSSLAVVIAFILEKLGII